MMEVMKKPTLLEIKKVQERLGDNVTFALVQASGKALENYLNKDYFEIEFDNFMLDYSKWYRMTRLMLLDNSVKQVVEMVLKISNDMADDYWPWDLTTPIKKSKAIFKTNSKLPILEIAEKLGIKIKKDMCVCPFHADGKPSLKFYPETNSFYCFGCNSGGDVLTFIQHMEELKNGV